MHPPPVPPLEFHFKVTDCPAWMLVGFAVSVTTGVVAVTVTCAVVDWPDPVQVNENVVLAARLLIA